MRTGLPLNALVVAASRGEINGVVFIDGEYREYRPGDECLIEAARGRWIIAPVFTSRQRDK